MELRINYNSLICLGITDSQKYADSSYNGYRMRATVTRFGDCRDCVPTEYLIPLPDYLSGSLECKARYCLSSAVGYYRLQMVCLCVKVILVAGRTTLDLLRVFGECKPEPQVSLLGQQKINSKRDMQWSCAQSHT